MERKASNNSINIIQ